MLKLRNIKNTIYLMYGKTDTLADPTDVMKMYKE